jgi:hypothetical protein
MKKLIAVALAATAATVFAVPSQNTYHAVTNDWYQGNYLNVYELAQQRLVANSNDLVAAVIMESYDLRFSSFAAISNSIQRLMRASEAATLPAYTNMYWRIYREGYNWYLGEYLPQQSEERRQSEMHKAYNIHAPMSCTHTLKLFWDENLW